MGNWTRPRNSTALSTQTGIHGSVKITPRIEHIDISHETALVNSIYIHHFTEEGRGILQLIIRTYEFVVIERGYLFESKWKIFHYVEN